MAKFKFRLQGYLGVKEKIEEQKKLEYGKAIKRLENEKEKKAFLINTLESTVTELRESMEAGIKPEEFIRYKQYMVHLEKEITKQDGEIKKAANFAESKRIELLGAVKQRKMLEVLKENDYEEYLIEEKKAEQKLVDEIVSFRHGAAE